MQHYLENKDWVGFRKTFERSEALEAPRIGDGLVLPMFVSIPR